MRTRLLRWSGCTLRTPSSRDNAVRMVFSHPPQWIWRTVIVTVVIMASYVPAPMPPALSP
jgi:hypothetical protein